MLPAFAAVYNIGSVIYQLAACLLRIANSAIIF